MNDTPDKVIPVLTEILQPGDADMLHHFDTTGFEPEQANFSPPQIDRIEQALHAALDELLPEFKRQLLERTLEKLDPGRTQIPLE